MNVIVESNLCIQNRFEPPLSLELPESSRIKDILLYLSGRHIPMNLITPACALNEDIDAMSINGEDFFRLKQGLDTPLNDGDRIQLQLQNVQLGGG
jgi:hypothetical protein